MNSIALRVLVSILFAAGLIVAGAGTASADYWGAYAWPSPQAYPGECLTAGVNILTDSSPDKHNVSGANSCFQGFTVDSDLYEYNSSGTIIEANTDEGTDYAQAHLQVTTSDGDYWGWSDCIDNGSACYDCDNEGYAYQDCFST